MTIDATTLKQFFKKRYGIPVRVRSSSGKAGWVEVYIASVPRAKGEPFNAPIRYAHTFPAELGRRCMGIAYEGHEGLTQQDWGGNIGKISISLLRPQWEKLLEAQEQPREAQQRAMLKERIDELFRRPPPSAVSD